MATAVWRGQLTFGLVTFPVKLFAAARRETIRFRNLRKRPEDEDPEPESQPVTAEVKKPGPVAVRAAAIRPSPAPEPVYTPEDRITRAAAEPPDAPVVTPVVKGYEFEKDRFIAIDPAEIRKLAKSTSRDLEVMEFVHWDEIDPAYLDASYFLVPDPGGEKPYSLLFAAMKKTGFAALGQLAMHGREQILVVRTGGKGLVGHTMFYANEVRRDEEFAANPDQVSAKELELAATLIKHLAGPFQPEQYANAYRERVQALIDQKVKNVPVAEETAAVAPMRAKPIDILDALKKSLEKAAQKKGPERATVPHTKKKRATG
ncbi:MAG: hypothetical protein M3Z09_16640 [Acidobacteriota bacterium]|nr:hypothetical protein [Acidobacteriota bacterium]